MKEKALQSFGKLLDIMDELREKCPWDQEQTIESIRHLTIEETYELSDAIIENNLDDVKKELGDLMLHLVFYSKIASETNDFDIADVIDSINHKLIQRHPHVFGDTKVSDAEDVKANWEHIKLKTGSTSVLSGVPKSLPALVKAYRIQEKARGVGFDWENPSQVLDKVVEEVGELKAEFDHNSPKEMIEAEFGDLFFSLINFARFINVNADDALEKTNRKFIKRFQYLEDQTRKLGKSLKDMTLEEMDIYWEEAKKK
ncbi:MAG: nucleoside triphosphate pyrophosphohydrolase [Bacteroidota bacterium]